MAAGHSPLAQFEIQRIVEFNIAGIDVSITNSTVWMVAALLVATFVLTLGMRSRAMVPTRMQSIAEVSYEFVANMVRDNAGSECRAYFPFLFTLFFFILMCNALGMIPYSFTPTSHIIVTFGMAAVVFVGVTIIGFAKHGIGYLRLFAPSGVPLVLMFILVPIEVISYFVRPISLSVRLFANMMAGHTMLKVFGGFVVSLGAIEFVGPVIAALPMAMVVALSGLELVIAFLQAYVFTILSCLYLHDALHPGH